MFNDFFTSLQKEASELKCVDLTETVAMRLFRHLTELEEKGKLFNLTAITDPDEARVKHTLDCLYCADVISKLSDGNKCTLIDIGSGGGFPSLPIAFALDNVSVTALDSTAKKCVFISDTAAAAGVSVSVLPCRAEEAARDHRESFDFATARAVARLNILMELAAPFIKVGGYFVAMKGRAADGEIKEAQNCAAKLGLEFEGAIPYEIEGGGTRFIVTYKKISPTPPAYPRAFAQIKKKPL